MIIFCVGIFSFGMAFFSLWATGFALGFTAIVGTMGMVGIAINDSIVVLAELRSDPLARMGDLDSIINLVMRSTRHVLSTTFTVGCSFVPMLIEGGTFWPPMAMVISGGVFGATVLGPLLDPGGTHSVVPTEEACCTIVSPEPPGASPRLSQ